MFVHIDAPPRVELSDKITDGKRWYTTPSGVKYPSITTILGAKEKPWLKDWKNMLGPDKAKKEMKRAANRGTAVHLLAERYLNNEEDPTRGEPALAKKLFNQLKFRLNKINNIRAQEVPLYSDTLRIAGRVDCIAEYEGVLSVIDFKTSTNNKDIEKVQDYFLQCTAYALMYDEMFDVFIEDFVVLITVEKGIMPLMFKDKIDNYVEPLVERINMFYKGARNG